MTGPGGIPESGQARLVQVDPDAPVEPPRRGLSRKSIAALVALVVVLLALAVTVPLLIRHLVREYALRTYVVPSASMEPAIELDDRVLVDKLSYRFDDPSRGDVVLYDAGSENAIGRIVATEGRTVACCDPQNRLTVDGVALDEPYRGDLPAPQPEFAPVVVPDGHVYVLGDNRTAPEARIVDEDDVVGRAILVVYPFDHWDAITDE